MGKIDKQYLHQEQIHDIENGGSSGESGLLCPGCSMGLQKFSNQFTFKCFFVLLLSLSVLLSGIFWVLPRYTTKTRFDAKDDIKLSATIQAYFRLEKPASQLIPYIERLEYDIYSEIGLPNTKVAILSMHQSGASESDWTDVMFGVLSDPMTVPINPVSLSVLRSSLIELFLQQSNLTLTTSVFGNASSFEILKFHGGITVIPVQSASFWQKHEIMFNFTLNNSVSEMLDNFSAFKDELKYGLNLSSYENVYVQITNIHGSTVDPPVVVQASVVSDEGLLPQRLKQLAQTITGSPAKNLGLSNSVFGKVKGISLSSFLNRTLLATPPSPSPAPSPQTDYTEPSKSPSAPPPSLAPSPTIQVPCFDCEVSAPAPSVVTPNPSRPCPDSGISYPPSPSPLSYSNPSFPPDTSHPAAVAPTPPPASHSASPSTEASPDLSATSEVPCGSNVDQGKGRAARLVSSSLAPSP